MILVRATINTPNAPKFMLLSPNVTIILPLALILDKCHNNNIGLFRMRAQLQWGWCSRVESSPPIMACSLAVTQVEYFLHLFDCVIFAYHTIWCRLSVFWLHLVAHRQWTAICSSVHHSCSGTGAQGGCATGIQVFSMSTVTVAMSVAYNAADAHHHSIILAPIAHYMTEDSIYRSDTHCNRCSSW